MRALVIDMWMDIGCPWSRISLVELQRAIKEVGRDVEIRFHSLRLDPDAPADYGQTTIEHLCETLNVDVVGAEKMLQVVEDAGVKVGLGFNFLIARGANSLDAHRLIRCAHEYGKHVEVAIALFTAHFEQGLLISDRAVLRGIAVGVGVPGARVDAVLSGNEFLAEVVADETAAMEQGIEQTPTFVFAGDERIVGAQKLLKSWVSGSN